ncbi:hypothetical protein BC659_1875 [Sediminibacterium goheungense]|uniref:Uncharacterized protein n=1 Tax=Sediminibacterium goheungense TaxID=1086393 RepID=A0A4V3C4M6_9BACT|nr:hypothetical protein BC659_1875 [Sediminibacterium goheungense]
MKTILLKKEIRTQAVFVSRETLAAVLRHFFSVKVDRQKNIPRFFHFRFHSVIPWHSFNMKNQLTYLHPLGIAWCLLQTQFAKKPKNPV